jgi:hypothetical protein
MAISIGFKMDSEEIENKKKDKGRTGGRPVLDLLV